MERSRLFVIDGAKGLRKAIKEVFGSWALVQRCQALSRLRDLAAQLETDHPGAASSLLEGLAETVTVLRLGAAGWLLKTLSTTNPIENVQGTLAKVSRNVKRWRDGAMALRWGVTGLLAAEAKFRRIKGITNCLSFSRRLALSPVHLLWTRRPWWRRNSTTTAVVFQRRSGHRLFSRVLRDTGATLCVIAIVVLAWLAWKST